MAKLDYEILKKYTDAIPNAEHTHLLSLKDLENVKECVVCKYGEHDDQASILLSVKRDKSGKLTCYYSADKDGHALIIGSSGSGKSQGFGMSTLMNADGRQSYIVSDPKGEYYKATYTHLCEVYGAENVKTLNFMQPKRTDLHVNHLCVLGRMWEKVSQSKDEAYKKSVWDNIVSAIRKYAELYFVIEDVKQPSWERIGRRYIVAIILGLFEDLTLTKEEEKKTHRRRTTPEMLNWYNIHRIAQEISRGSGSRYSFNDKGFFSGRSNDSLAKQYADSIINNAENTRANYLGFADNFLKQVIDPNILEISAYDDFDIKSLGKTPQVVFVIYDISDEGIREYVNKVIAQIINILLEYTHKTVKPLDITVKLFLDEFATLKPCPVYPNILATGRGSNIFLYMVVQSYSQLEARYPDEFQAMIENCNFTYFIGTNDSKTAKKFADEMGETTVPNPINYLCGTFSTLVEPVVSQDYLMHRMKDGEVFVKVHRRQPIHGFFEFYYKTPEYNQNPIAEKKAIAHAHVIDTVYDAPWLHPEDESDEDDEEDEEEFDDLLSALDKDDENDDEPIRIPAEITSEDDEVYDNIPPKPLKISVLPSDFDMKSNYAKCVYNAMVCGTTSEIKIQSSMPIGYTETLKILKQMQDDGYITPYRKKCGHIVYKSVITEEQFRERFCPHEKDEKKVDLASLYTKGFDMQEEKSNVINLDATAGMVMNDPVPDDAFSDIKGWKSQSQFEDLCMELIEKIVSMDKAWGRQDALLEAARQLLVVRCTKQPIKAVQVHVKVLYEFQIATDEEYEFLRKTIFGD